MNHIAPCSERSGVLLLAEVAGYSMVVRGYMDIRRMSATRGRSLAARVEVRRVVAVERTVLGFAGEGEVMVLHDFGPYNRMEV